MKKIIVYFIISTLSSFIACAEEKESSLLIVIGDFDEELFKEYKDEHDLEFCQTRRSIAESFSTERRRYLEKNSAVHYKTFFTKGAILKSLQTSIEKFKSLLDKNSIDQLSAENAQKILEGLFILYTSLNFINYALDSRIIRTYKNSLCVWQEQDIEKEKIDDLSLQYYLFFYKRMKILYDYQSKKMIEPVLKIVNSPDLVDQLATFFDPLYQESSTAKINKATAYSASAINEMYEILMMNFLSCLTMSKNPILNYIYRVAINLSVYFYTFSYMEKKKQGQSATRASILSEVQDLMFHSPYNCLSNRAEMVYLGEDKLHVNMSPELQMIYFNLYNKVTHNNTVPFFMELHDFWAGKFTIKVTPTIPGIIDGYVSPAKITKPLEEPSSRKHLSNADEIDKLMKEFGLEDATSSKPKRKGKTKTAAGEKTSSKESAAASADSDDDTTKVPSVNHNDTDSFYTFNRVLATKQIELDSRILNWYRTTQRGTNKGITTQGYLDKDTDRNSIFTREVSLCHGNQESAIARIIFRHQLPYSLIRTIVSYGTIQESSTDAETTVTALVGYTQGASQSTHFLGEITGSIDRNTFKIWHSFLRPIDNMQRFLRTNLSSMNHLRIESSGEDLDAMEDQQFTILGEQEGWRVDDRFSQIVISKDDSQYVVFKN